jgi:hypothetical protein
VALASTVSRNVPKYGAENLILLPVFVFPNDGLDFLFARRVQWPPSFLKLSRSDLHINAGNYLVRAAF